MTEVCGMYWNSVLYSLKNDVYAGFNLFQVIDENDKKLLAKSDQ